MLPPPSELERILSAFRRSLLNRERAAASAMVRVYGQAWEHVLRELNRLDAEYQQSKQRGETPTWSWIYQFNRMTAFRYQLERELNKFSQYASDAIRAEQLEAIKSAELYAEELTKLIVGQMPEGARIAVKWNRLPTSAIEQIVGATQAGSPLYRLLATLAGSSVQAAVDVLITGLLLGKGPRHTARLLRKALGTTLSQALRISRTETLRAFREASRQSFRQNQNVVEGWIWCSARDKRTCASCWAMHGTKHTLEETLDDHPNGRCTMIPLVKEWPIEIESGAALFEKLSEAEQIKILGPAKWIAWRDGQLTFDADSVTGIVGRAFSDEWGSHRYERSLKQMGLNASDLLKTFRSEFEEGGSG